jgi:hypothetical protein
VYCGPEKHAALPTSGVNKWFFVKVANLIEGCSTELEELDSSAGTVHAFKKGTI